MAVFLETATCPHHGCELTGFTTVYCPRCVKEAEAPARWNPGNWQAVGQLARDTLPRYTIKQKDGAAAATVGLLVFCSDDPDEFPIHGNPRPPDWLVGDFIYRILQVYGTTQDMLVRFCIQDPMVVAYTQGLLSAGQFQLDAQFALPKLHFSGRVRHQLHYPDGIMSDILVRQLLPAK